jgi:cell division septation protein DedD
MKKLLVALLALIMIIGCVPTAFAADASPVKDYATAKDGDLLYTVNFKGDSAFTPAVIYGTHMDFVVSEDGSAVTIKGNGTDDQKMSFWGGKIAGLDFDETKIYTMTYKASAKASDAKNNSIGIGGVLQSDIAGSQTKWLNNYANHGVSDAQTPRSSISIANEKQKGTTGKPASESYVLWANLAKAPKKDADGFVEMMIVFNAVKNEMVTYVLAADGTWQFLESMTIFGAAGQSVCFISYAFYKVVNTTVKDVKYYKGDLVNPASVETEPEATEPEATEPEATEPKATEPEATEGKTTEAKGTDKPTDANTEAPKEEGCGGSVAFMGVAMVAAVGACTVAVSKKKKED